MERHRLVAEEAKVIEVKESQCEKPPLRMIIKEGLLILTNTQMIRKMWSVADSLMSLHVKSSYITSYIKNLVLIIFLIE